MTITEASQLPQFFMGCPWFECVENGNDSIKKCWYAEEWYLDEKTGCQNCPLDKGVKNDR